VINLTRFQREEVEGLLDVCADNYANGERPDEGWGALYEDLLMVLDPVEAEEDLTRRADYLESEAPGHGRNGSAGARSLRRLAKLVTID
jgi:hypothetical protein